MNVTTYLYHAGQKIGWRGNATGHCPKCGKYFTVSGEHNIPDGVECDCGAYIRYWPSGRVITVKRPY
jgi:predicted nucleic acid binding AN1-type Zn finger protein